MLSRPDLCYVLALAEMETNQTGIHRDAKAVCVLRHHYTNYHEYARQYRLNEEEYLRLYISTNTLIAQNYPALSKACSLLNYRKQTEINGRKLRRRPDGFSATTP